MGLPEAEDQVSGGGGCQRCPPSISSKRLITLHSAGGGGLQWQPPRHSPSEPRAAACPPPPSCRWSSRRRRTLCGISAQRARPRTFGNKSLGISAVRAAAAAASTTGSTAGGPRWFEAARRRQPLPSLPALLRPYTVCPPASLLSASPDHAVCLTLPAPRATSLLTYALCCALKFAWIPQAFTTCRCQMGGATRCKWRRMGTYWVWGAQGHTGKNSLAGKAGYGFREGMGVAQSKARRRNDWGPFVAERQPFGCQFKRSCRECYRACGCCRECYRACGGLKCCGRLSKLAGEGTHTVQRPRQCRPRMIQNWMVQSSGALAGSPPRRSSSKRSAPLAGSCSKGTCRRERQAS